MPPMTPTKKASRRASRVEDDAQEQKPRARRRQSTGSMEGLEQEAMEGLEQEANTSEAQDVDMSEAQGPSNDQSSGREQGPTTKKAPSKRKRRRQNSTSQPSYQGTAQKYVEWKDDLEFVAVQGAYWGTVAPRLPDRALGLSLSKKNGDEQKREGAICTPCILQGLKCSGDKPICTQCRPQDGVASSAGKAPAMCSYPINRAFVPKSKHITRRRMREDLESNLAAAVEYLDGRVDSDEEGGEEGGKEGGKEPTPSSEGSWKTGVQGEAESDEGEDSLVPAPERTVWLAKALLAEGRMSRASDKTQTETGSGPAEEAQDRADKPIQPRKRGRPRGSTKTRSSPESSKMRNSRGGVIARLLRTDFKPTRPRRGVLSGRNPPKLRNILKSTSRMLKAAGTWVEAPTTSAQGQELGSTGVISNTDESDEDGKIDDGDDLDTEKTTPPIPKYKKQITGTFRPWIARQDEKIIPSACDLPETSFLQALHYYASYYYTHVSPSPDMFEAMDLTSHIALGMIIQEIISDFAFKLGKESQLEDIQVKVDKLIAAQHRNKWDANFVAYLKSLTADESLPLKQPNRKRRRVRSGEGLADSTDDADSDTDGNEDNDDIGHGFRSWDELEGLRRITTSLGVSTMKELVNRTSFDLGEDGNLGIDNGGYGDMDGTHLDGQQQQLDRYLTAFASNMNIDARSSDGSDVDNTIVGSGSRWTQLTSTSSEATVLNQPAFHADSDAEDDIGLVSEENDFKARDSDSSEEDNNQDQNNQDDNDMPEIDFSQSIFSQLSNKRFGSQFKFRLEASTDEDEDEDEDEVDGVDRLRSRTLAQSQVIQDEIDTSSEAESDSSESDSEQAEKEKESDAEDNMDAEMDGDIQDEEDFWPSVLTQVNETRFGSVFTTQDDDSSNDEDSSFNIAGGRFLAQSQVIQDDSDDPSEVQEDSSASGSEQEKEADEGEDFVAMVNKEEGSKQEEKQVKKNDNRDDSEESGAEERNEEREEDEESDAEGYMDVEMGDGIQDEEGFSSSVLTQVSETRFGSAFTDHHDSSSDDDFGFNIASGRFIAQSQVVQDDSDDSSEAQEDSSATESEQEEDDEGEDAVPVMNKEEESKEQEIKEEASKEKEKDDKDDNKEERNAEERREEEKESDAEEYMDVEMDGGIQDEDEFSPSVLTQVGETRFGSALTNQDESSSDEDFGSNIAGGRFLDQSQVVQDDGGDSSEAQVDDKKEDSVAVVNKEEEKEMKGIKKNNREDDGGEESDAEGQKDVAMEDGEDGSEEEGDAEGKNVDAGMDSEAQEIEDDFPPSIFTQLSQSGFSSAFTSQDDGSSDEDFSFNIDGGRSLAQLQVVQKPVEETPSREGSIEQDEEEESQQQFTTVNATRFGSKFSNSYDASDDDDESEDDGGSYATQSQVVLDDSSTDEEDVRADNDSGDSD
ncbi:hypothetical protein BGW39_008392 [Mortierella sp. 14UC]|nr:hypothetical protein BGW39_008392 [Mortierella sp. 14UC]